MGRRVCEFDYATASSSGNPYRRRRCHTALNRSWVMPARSRSAVGRSYLWAMRLAEPATALTDLALAAQAWIYLRRYTTSVAGGPGPDGIRTWFAILFGAIAVGAAAGAALHGPLSDERARLHRILWRVSLASVGAAGLATWAIATRMLFGRSVARVLTALAGLRLAHYFASLRQCHATYQSAIGQYIPGAGLLSLAFASRLFSARDRRASVYGLGALVLTAGATFAQQRRVGLHPRHFDHNAVYHVVQGIALVLLERSARLTTGGRG
jgi:hypothetical protein